MRITLTLVSACLLLAHSTLRAEEKATETSLNKGDSEGWVAYTLDDFEHVNCDKETWSWKDEIIHCTGTPVGVIKSKKPFKNFEMVVEWKHLKSGGNSGVFVWASKEALTDLPRGRLPGGGIEVQVLDHGYATQYKERTGKEPDWFTTNGDVFPVGASKMKPFPPMAPNGRRSFPTKDLSKGVNEWNHYYITAIDGVVRLHVNGEEVSGGEDCQPSEGFLCLESEGAPVQFRNIRIRELP